jgi:hypothetical protein
MENKYTLMEELEELIKEETGIDSYVTLKLISKTVLRFIEEIDDEEIKILQRGDGDEPVFVDKKRGGGDDKEKPLWEKDFEDFYWERGEYKYRLHGIEEVKKFIRKWFRPEEIIKGD